MSFLRRRRYIFFQAVEKKWITFFEGLTTYYKTIFICNTL